MCGIYCFYCLHAIKHLYIHCVDCKCVKLCLFCFSCGVEAGQHKRTHRYSVRYAYAPENSPCVFNGWSDNEDLELLDAIERYGVGNWEDISEKCIQRTSQECFEHYNTFYLQGQLAALIKERIRFTSPIMDHTVTPMAASSEKQVSALSLDPLEQQILGYMILRDDFERDYDNDAESLLTRLKVHPGCDDLEKALHVAHVNIYTQRLRERQKRKEIGRLHGLISRISAYLMNRRVRRRQNTKSQASQPLIHSPPQTAVLPKTVKRGRGRPPVYRQQTVSPPTVSPPAGSWLAAPYALQSSGPTRGIPLVVSGVVSLPPKNELGDDLQLAAGSHVATDYDSDDYDSFNINEKLKPFLRYFTSKQAKIFLGNLHREEVLKQEIKYLMNFLQKGVGLNAPGTKLKMLALRSQVYVPAPKNPDPAFTKPETNGDFSIDCSTVNSCLKSKKRRRRHGPWYSRTNRPKRRTD